MAPTLPHSEEDNDPQSETRGPQLPPQRVPEVSVHLDVWPRTQDDGKSQLFETFSYYVNSEILHHLSEAVSSAKLGDSSHSVRLIDNQIELLLAK